MARSTAPAENFDRSRGANISDAVLAIEILFCCDVVVNIMACRPYRYVDEACTTIVQFILGGEQTVADHGKCQIHASLLHYFNPDPCNGQGHIM
jgi:hypothetical protein